MDLAEAKRVTSIAIEIATPILGLERWTFDVQFEELESGTYGEINRLVDYRNASIKLDAKQAKNVEHLIQTVLHELAHAVLSAFDLMYSLATAGMKSESPELRQIDRVFDHACERTVMDTLHVWKNLGLNRTIKRAVRKV